MGVPVEMHGAVQALSRASQATGASKLWREKAKALTANPSRPALTR